MTMTNNDRARLGLPLAESGYERGYRAGLEDAAREIINICCAETQCQVGIEVARRIAALAHKGQGETNG